MKTSRYVALCGVIFASVGISTPAFAQKYNQFANLNGVGDCQYETGANLILHEFPSAKITTNEVVSAFTQYGAAWDGQQVQQSNGSWLNEGLWAGQEFLISHGFDGHRAKSITEISQAQVPLAAQNGGVEVVNNGPVRQHVFAIIGASKTHVVIVDDGFTYHYSWAWVNYAYTQDSETLQYYAVSWS
jgi:hypothetical protein